LLNLIESNEAAFAFYVHLLLLLLRSDATLFSFTDCISELVLDLPAESLDCLLHLAHALQFPSKLSTEANEEFIIPDFAILLEFLGKYASDLKHLPLCDEFGFLLMTLESFPRAAHAVIGSANPVIEAVLNDKKNQTQ
jgi:hypothetical protein